MPTFMLIGLVSDFQNTPTEHAIAEAHTLPYQWIVEAVSRGSREIASDIMEAVEHLLQESPPGDIVMKTRLQLLLEALHDEIGE